VTLPDRKAVTEALRATGMSRRQIDALYKGGWRTLVGEVQAESDELKETLERLQEAIQSREA
jgi:hypothetical protein